VLRENDISVGIDVFGIVKPQLHHGGNHVLEAVGADERSCLGYLLYRKEGGIHSPVIMSLVLLLYQ
jgi:hypothetical protein